MKIFLRVLLLWGCILLVDYLLSFCITYCYAVFLKRPFDGVPMEGELPSWTLAAAYRLIYSTPLLVVAIAISQIVWHTRRPWIKYAILNAGVLLIVLNFFLAGVDRFDFYETVIIQSQILTSIVSPLLLSRIKPVKQLMFLTEQKR